MEEKRLKQQSDLQSFLLMLLKEHMDRQLSVLPVASTTADNSTQVETIHKEHAARLMEVKALFKEVDTRQRKEVPDYLCGKISFELMTDPCITPSGVTYDRKDIEEHLQRVGHFDPVTRQPLMQEQLIPNLAMKEVVDSFVAHNGWIEDY
jgi:STIP1 family protein 1